VPVIYKGSGFYTTDYGRPKPPAENGSSKTGSETSKSDSDSKPTETSTSSETREVLAAANQLRPPPGLLQADPPDFTEYPEPVPEQPAAPPGGLAVSCFLVSW
jgi:hypothetical protein